MDTNEDESGSDTVTRELEEFRAQIDRILEESPKVENYGGKLPLIERRSIQPKVERKNRKKNYYEIDKEGNLLKFRGGQLVKKVSNSQASGTDEEDDRLIPFSGKKRLVREAPLAQSYDT